MGGEKWAEGFGVDASECEKAIVYGITKATKSFGGVHMCLFKLNEK